MIDCEFLTKRGHWCKLPALPGERRCELHTGMESTFSADDYRVADARLYDDQLTVRCQRRIERASSRAGE